MGNKRDTQEILGILQTNGIRDWSILIVDDNRDNLGVASKVLNWQGAVVHTALNGVEGMTLLETLTPTLILLDLTMPHMDGWTMIEKVRAIPHLAHIPIIALTARVMEADLRRITESGFDNYIAKPFHISDFLGVIFATLSRSMSARI